MAGKTETDNQIADAIAVQLEAAHLLAPNVFSLRQVGIIPQAFKDPLPAEFIFGMQESGVAVTAVGVDDYADRVTVFTTKAISPSLRTRSPKPIGEVEIVFALQKFHAMSSSRVGPPVAGVRAEARLGAPIPCGASISLGNTRSAGTMGALVRIGEDEAIYGLTCNHVTGGCNIVKSGVPVLHPGVLDIDCHTERVELLGYQSVALPIRQGQAAVLIDPRTGEMGPNHDAALFRIRDEKLVTSFQFEGLDTPTRIVVPSSGLQVRKVGRTTGVTRGRLADEPGAILDYKHPVPIDASSVKSFQGVCSFPTAWRIATEGSKNNFAVAGDSGSLVITEDGSAAVGLLFSADAKSGDGYILPIGPILEAFGAQLVNGHPA